MNHLAFFKAHGIAPIGNRRQAWDGELPDKSRVLVLWYDEAEGNGVYRALERKPTGRHRGTGPIHRLTSLQRIEAGFPAFAIIADAKDTKVRPRAVKRVRSQCLTPIEAAWRDADSWRVRLKRVYTDGPGMRDGDA